MADAEDEHTLYTPPFSNVTFVVEGFLFNLTNSSNDRLLMSETLVSSNSHFDIHPPSTTG
jgi:hypothetical protein